MSIINNNYQIKLFKDIHDNPIRLYCRLINSRKGIIATYSIYEDKNNLKWLSIETSCNTKSAIIPLDEENINIGDYNIIDQLTNGFIGI